MLRKNSSATERGKPMTSSRIAPAKKCPKLCKAVFRRRVSILAYQSIGVLHRTSVIGNQCGDSLIGMKLTRA